MIISQLKLTEPKTENTNINNATNEKNLAADWQVKNSISSIKNKLIKIVQASNFATIETNENNFNSKIIIPINDLYNNDNISVKFTNLLHDIIHAYETSTQFKRINYLLPNQLTNEKQINFLDYLIHFNIPSKVTINSSSSHDLIIELCYNYD